MSIPTFSASTTADEVATAFATEINGRNVLITGTSLNGIGFETARVIAKHANLVIIAGHNAERLKLSEEAIKKDSPSANLRTLILDLSSLASVRKAATEVNAYPELLHVLVHNAAAALGPFRLTEDGLENQMATDHVGPFLLTKLLAPKLLATSRGAAGYVPRVIFVSSISQANGSGVDFNTLAHPDPEKYTSLGAYSQAKTANVLAAIELTKRAKGRINAYSIHPGIIYTNIYMKKETIPDLQAVGIIGPDGKPNTQFQWKTIPEGAATTVAAAFDPRLDGTPGAYLSDCVEANKDLAPHSSDAVSPPFHSSSFYTRNDILLC
ncbi:NAD-P-binding protein [Mycena maculata]|uniref:NAD-P-binding protein n=1 Tax=Mycena maculata TaxID=230809 RepID=A0AAD7NM47_9AGAR|nr:NAD-P-binding protein [Mycena maculata]